MDSNFVIVGEKLLTKHSEEEYEYVDKKKELNFYFVMDEPDEVAIIVFDDLSPKDKSNEACLGTLFVESLEEAVKETSYITKDNVSKFIMWE